VLSCASSRGETRLCEVVESEFRLNMFVSAIQGEDV
jgi:hypothetical protein